MRLYIYFRIFSNVIYCGVEIAPCTPCQEGTVISSRYSARIRGGIVHDLEGHDGCSCPIQLRESGLLLWLPYCIGSHRDGRTRCLGRVGACGRLRCGGYTQGAPKFVQEYTVCVGLGGLPHLTPQVFRADRSHVFDGVMDGCACFSEEAKDEGSDCAELIQS